MLRFISVNLYSNNPSNVANSHSVLFLRSENTEDAHEPVLFTTGIRILRQALCTMRTKAIDNVLVHQKQHEGIVILAAALAL